jgi:hypothetical protein
VLRLGVDLFNLDGNVTMCLVTVISSIISETWSGSLHFVHWVLATPSQPDRKGNERREETERRWHKGREGQERR